MSTSSQRGHPQRSPASEGPRLTSPLLRSTPPSLPPSRPRLSPPLPSPVLPSLLQPHPHHPQVPLTLASASHADHQMRCTSPDSLALPPSRLGGVLLHFSRPAYPYSPSLLYRSSVTELSERSVHWAVQETSSCEARAEEPQTDLGLLTASSLPSLDH